MNVYPCADRRTSSVRSYFLSWLLAFMLVTGSAAIRLNAQCTLVCNANLQISLPASGQFTLTPDVIAPTATNLCPGPLQLTVWETPGLYIPNNQINCDYAGATLTAKVQHLASGNSCTSQILIKDLLAPQLSCPVRTVNCASDPEPFLIGAPDIQDNCTPLYQLNVSYYDQTTNFPCGTVQNGMPVSARLNRTWQVSDAAGNQSTCLEQIWLRSGSLDSIVFPVNLDDFAAPALQCGDDPYDLAIAGAPTLYDLPVNNAGFCDIGLLHSDQTIAGCSPGSFTVLRTWTAVDLCTNQILNHIQVIKVADKTPPTITAATDTIYFSTNVTNCAATVLLPQLSVSDACSGVTVTPVWEFGSGFGPYNQVPAGVYTITYIATDQCGNSAESTRIISVADDAPPQVICVSSLQISLGTNGKAFVNAAALDAGSWDNCGPVTLAVSRDNINWTSVAELNCADQNAPVAVFLRVTDETNQSNFCEVEVTPRDFLKPVINCPPNITLNCLDNASDTQLTGLATATDNCSAPGIIYTDTNDLSACNTGSVLRRWLATDASGNTKTCQQTILLAPLTATNVIFPADITFNGCDGPADITPQANGEPLVVGDVCFPLSVIYTDQVFNIAPPACFVISRKWKVIDQCINMNNGVPPGYWEHTQQINVVDQSPPLLIPPPDITVSSGVNCEGVVALTDAVATDCSPAISISHNSPYAAPGTNASGTYPPGVHQVIFTANDGCGNSAQATVQITVTDQIAPTALCFSGLSLNITPGGVATVAPALLNAGSTDNCTIADSLVMSTDPPWFSCQHVGMQVATLRVSDQSGNTGQCTALIQVQDNDSFCARHTLSGHLYTPANAPVPNISVTDGQGHFAISDANGFYEITDLLPGLNYVVHPAHNQNWLNGVNAWDFILISRHILGLEPLNTPEKIIAADANGSGTVTTFDIVQLRKVLLGTQDTVPDGKSWHFIPATYVFSDPTNPFNNPLPAAIELPGLDGDHTDLDFRAIKSGDVDQNADPQMAILNFVDEIGRWAAVVSQFVNFRDFDLSDNQKAKE